MLLKMLTIYPILPGCQEHSDGHLHSPGIKSSAIFRKLLAVSGSRVLIFGWKYQ